MSTSTGTWGPDPMPHPNAVPLDDRCVHLGTTSREERNQALASEIKAFLKTHQCWSDVRIYFNEKCHDSQSGLIKNIKPSDFFDYANDNTVSMSFEGPLYILLNDPAPTQQHIVEKFYQLFEKYGYIAELGNNWNLFGSEC